MNCIILKGRLAKDIELKYVNGQTKNVVEVLVKQIEFCGYKTNDNQFSDNLINNTTNYTIENENSLDLPF